MKPSQIKLLIFDFDGTLAQTKTLYLQTICSVLAKHGYSVSQREVLQHVGIKLPPLLKAVGVKRKDIRKLAKRVNAQVIAQASRLRACAGIKALQKLSGYKHAVVSNSLSEFIQPLLSKHKLHFDAVLGGGNFRAKPDAFRSLFRKFKVKPFQAVYIADRREDVRIAKAVQCRMIAVSNRSSWSSYSELKQEKPDAIISYLTQLPRLFPALHKSL